MDLYPWGTELRPKHKCREEFQTELGNNTLEIDSGNKYLITNFTYRGNIQCRSWQLREGETDFHPGPNPAVLIHSEKLPLNSLRVLPAQGLRDYCVTALSTG